MEFLSELKASLKKAKGSDNLSGVKVAVQGTGSVGFNLCRELHEEGATIYATDLDKDSLKKVVDEFNAKAVLPDEIYGLDVDVFAPCAMGGIVNDDTISKLKCSIISGGANNQMKDEKKHSEKLKEMGILYAPHFVVNAGGLIGVSAEYSGAGRDFGWAKIDEVYTTLLRVFEVAEKENITSIQAANNIALERIEKINLCSNIYN